MRKLDQGTRDDVEALITAIEEEGWHVERYEVGGTSARTAVDIEVFRT